MARLASMFFLLVSAIAQAQSIRFSGGDSSSVLLCSDGKVYTSGHNYYGQRGVGIAPSTNIFQNVSGISGMGSLPLCKQVTSHLNNTTMALSISGDTLISWGLNSNGQLGNSFVGDNFSENNRYPYRVEKAGGSGFLTNVWQVAVGGNTSYALLKDSTVVAWGDGSHGQLGNGFNSVASPLPTHVLKAPLDTLKGVVAIAAGSSFALALLKDRTVWAWGENISGQLAQNHTSSSNFAIPVKNHSGSGLLQNIIAIACGGDHAFALSAYDTLWAWGKNDFGQLGINNTISQLLPVYVRKNSVGQALRGVRKIACGKEFSMVLTADSSLLAWGKNDFGQLGINSTINQWLPTHVREWDNSANIKHIVDLSCGTTHAFAQKHNGQLLAWGNNSHGQLGLADNVNRWLPSIVSIPCTINTPPYFTGTVSNVQHVCHGINSGSVRVSGHLGQVVHWQTSTDNFATWSIIPHNDSVLHFSNLTQHTYYRALISYDQQLGYTSIASVMVDQPAMGGTIQSNKTVCALSNKDTLRLQSYSGTIQFWQYSTDLFSSTVHNLANTNDTWIFENLTTTTAFRVAVKNGSCPVVFSDTVIVTVDTPTNAGILNGTDTVCISSNSGSLMLYGYTGNILQWQYSQDNFSTYYTLSNTTAVQGYSNLTTTTWYRVLVKNGVCPAQYSTVAYIMVDILPVGGTTSGADTVCFGSNSGTIVLSGHYGNILRWEFSTDNFSTFINPITNNAPHQNFLNLTTDTWYRAVVKNGVCDVAYSTSAMIKVDPLTVGGTIQSSAVICSGINSGTLNLTGSIGTVLLWQYSNDNFTSDIHNITNTTTSQSYNNLTATTYYRALLKNGVCPSQFSSVAILTTTPQTVGGHVNSPATVCSGINSGTLNLAGQTGTVLRWEFSTDNFLSDINTIVNTSTSQSYTNLSTTTWFRAVVKNGPCPVQTSSSVMITVDAPSQGGVVSSSDTVCAGSNGGLLTLSGHTGSVLRWQQSTDNFNSVIIPISNTSTSQSYFNLSTTLYYRAEVKNGVCPPAFSSVATIRVDQPSVGGITGPSKTVCTGLNADSLRLTGFVGSIVRWEYSTDNFSSSVTPIANTSAIQHYSNLTATTYFRAIVKNGVCPATVSSVSTIFITPLSYGGTLNFPDTVCDGFNSGFLFLSSHVGNILRWESSTDNFSSQITILSNTTPIQPYSNLSNTTSYRVLVRNGTCPAVYSPIVNITVNPNSNGGYISGSDTVCTVNNSGVLQLSGYLGTVVQWEASTDNFATVSVPIANTSDFYSYSGLTTTTYYRALIQNAVCPIAYSTTAVIRVDQNSVGGVINTPTVVCAGSNFGTLSLSGNLGNVLHWEKSTDNFSYNIDTLHTSSTTLNYSNLMQTTYYRVLVKNGICPGTYSNTIAITVNPGTIPGYITGTTEVCESRNTGFLALNGFNGNILRWEYSFDNFSGFTYNIINYNDTMYFFNINNTRYYRALVQFPPCPTAYSDTFVVHVHNSTKSGTLQSDTIVTSGYNQGTLQLKNYYGSIIQWENSTDYLNWTVIDHTSPSYQFIDIDTTTWYRVLVKSGVCPAQYSNVIQIKTQPVTSSLIKIYPTISPNNDGINDEWIIDNIQLFPLNKVQIFNRWGNMVYSEHGYDNAQRVWKGQSNVSPLLYGTLLPEGTYYYVIDPGTGDEVYSGYVVLNR